MSAGFEARARITADVSGFVAASRTASAAARQLGLQSRALRSELANVQNAARAASTGFSSLINTQRDASQAQTANARAAQNNSQAQRAQAQATNTASQANRQNAQTMSMNTAEARRMGQEMARLSQIRRNLMQVQRQQGQLDAQQQAQLNGVRQTLRALGQQYATLNTQTRSYVDTARRAASASQQIGTAANAAGASVRNLSSSARNAQTAVGQLGRTAEGTIGNLWALRSAGQDVAQGLETVARTATDAFRSMWEVFSTQEVAIAHFSRVTQESSYVVNELTEEIRSLGQQIPIAFQDLAEITIFGAQVGIANNRLADFTETVALFAETTPVAADQAALMFARIQQMTNIEDTQIRNLGAAVSELGSNSAALESEILTTIESIAVVTTQAGLAETSIIGLGGAMASLRIRPELARGAMQRVLHQLGEAAQGASSQTDALARTLGMTQEEVATLQATNPDQFFFNLLEALNQTADGAGGLTSAIRELGIVNTRDIDVVSRLASNYELLEASVGLANRSFAEGTFLHQESSRLFDTLTARVQIAINTFQNFGARVFESLSMILTPLVNVAIQVGELLNRFAPVTSVVGAALLAFTGLAGILATVGAAAARLGVSYVALRGVIASLAAIKGTYAATLLGTTAATTANTAAVGANAAASTMAAGAFARLSAMATTAGVAMRAAWAASPAIVILAVAAAVTGVALAFDAIFNSSERANRKLVEANEQFQTMAGGVDALSQAIMQDTVEMNQLADATGRATDAFALSTREVNTSALAQNEMSTTAQEAANELTLLEQAAGMSASEILRAADAAGNADPELAGMAQKVRELQENIDDANDSAETVEVAFGRATHQWAMASAQAMILEHDILGTDEAFARFAESMEEAGGISTIVGAELMEAGAGAEYLRDAADEARDSMDGWELTTQTLYDTLSNVTFGLLDFTTESEQVARAQEDLADNLAATTIRLDEVSNSAELFTDQTLLLADGTMTTIEELEELGVAGHMLGQEILPAATDATREFGVSVADLAESFAGFIDPVEAWNDAMEGTTGTSEAAGQALIDMQVNAMDHMGDFISGMEDMQTAQLMWAENLLELSGRVPDEVLAGLSEMGAEGAGIVAGLVDSTDEEVDRFVDLWESGSGMVLEEFSHTFSSFMRMARESGDTGGRDFAMNLMEQVRDGEISFREATNEMTQYAEDEFADADPTMQAHLEVAEAIDNLTDLMASIAEHFGIMNEDAFVEAVIEADPMVQGVAALREQNASEFDTMQSDSTVTPEMMAESFFMTGDELSAYNSSNFRGMDDESYTEPDLQDDPFRSSTNALYNSNLLNFDNMRDDSWTEPEILRADWDWDLSNLFSTFGDRFRDMRSSSSVTPSLSTSGFISGLSSLLTTVRDYASSMVSALTISPSISGGKARGIHGKKDGGWVEGHGGPRQDNIPHMLSAGEFVINASAAREFGPLLEAINSQSGVGTGAVMAPNFAPPDTVLSPRRAMDSSGGTPVDIMRALQGVRDDSSSRINITVNNQYPQAEPTSITVNRALAFAGALDGVA